MTVINTNKPMLDRPVWEQLTFAPVAGGAGTCLVDDKVRYLYVNVQTAATSCQFWRYDTWGDTWQQLATPPKQTGAIANMIYTSSHGATVNGSTYGTVWLFTGNGTIVNFYHYNIASDTWTSRSAVNIPTTFATDCSLCYPSISSNAGSTSYHSGVTRTITSSAAVAVGAVTMTVSALPEALDVSTVLNFGDVTITVTAAAVKGSTTLSVSGVTSAIAVGTVLMTADGTEVCLSAAAASAAGSLTVFPIPRPIPASTKIPIKKVAVLTVAAAAAATSITVAPILVGIAAADVAGYYSNMYLVGNNGATMYRYNIPTNTWSTTSANAANPAIPVLAGSIGTGCALKWLPAYSPDTLWCLRGSTTSTVYVYNLVSNTWATEVYTPATETFTTGTCVATRDINGKQATLLIQKDATMRIYEGVPYKHRLEPKMTQWLYPTSTTSVGDRSCIITSPDGIDFYYLLLHGTTALVRCAIIDS